MDEEKNVAPEEKNAASQEESAVSEEKKVKPAEKTESIEAEVGESPGWMHTVSKTSGKVAPSHIIPEKIAPLIKYLFNSRPFIYLGMFLAVFVYGIDHELGVGNSLMWALGYAGITIIILELLNFVIFKTGPLRKLLIQKIPGVKKQETEIKETEEKPQAKDEKTDEKDIKQKEKPPEQARDQTNPPKDNEATEQKKQEAQPQDPEKSKQEIV